MSVAFPALTTNTVGPVFYYRASRTAADAFTTAIQQWDDKILVTVDAAVSKTLSVLPCHELYEA
ncbi:hypothetical protein [Nocardia sp. XZ_19_231]|uniref:hypothetical protein n=1 Tax=Nocardia sp. XZ_19_231 TaxID=2769252 RepID=UPI00188F5125|nr:hypothetical protein [Nocardia sp. XZ_19_231]